MFLSNGVKRKKEWWETAFNKDYLTADSYFVSRARTKREISFLLRQTEKIGLARNAKILDLACGYGAHAIYADWRIGRRERKVLRPADILREFLRRTREIFLF